MATEIISPLALPAADKPAETCAEKPPHHDKIYVDRGFAVARRHGELKAIDWPARFLDLVAKLSLKGLVVAGRSLNEDLTRLLGQGLLQVLVAPVHIPVNHAGLILATNPNNIWASEGQFWVMLVPDAEAGWKAYRITNPGGSLRLLVTEVGVDTTSGEKNYYIKEEGGLYGDMKLPEWLEYHNGLKLQRPLLEAEFGDLAKLECLDLRPPRKSSPKKEKSEKKTEKRDGSPRRKDKKKKSVGKEEMKELKKKMRELKPVEAKKNVALAEKLLGEAQREYKAAAGPYHAAKLKYLEAKLRRNSTQ